MKDGMSDAASESPKNESRSGSVGRAEYNPWSAILDPVTVHKTHRPDPGLHIVATPIGNLDDMTLRAARTLATADLVLAEDSRVTARLLDRLGVRPKMAVYNDHNAARMRSSVIADLEAGKSVALVSDAGTPLISDPGFKLVHAARQAGITVYGLPGACAAITALSIAGLPSDRFMFLGFLPPKQMARRTALTEIRTIKATLILYEGPSRLPALLADMAAVLGPRSGAVARELTKLHEEVRTGTLQELADFYADAGPPRGEIVVLAGPPAETEIGAADIDQLLADALQEHRLKTAVDQVAQMTGAPRREVYQRALALKDARENS